MVSFRFLLVGWTLVLAAHAHAAEPLQARFETLIVRTWPDDPLLVYGPPDEKAEGSSTWAEAYNAGTQESGRDAASLNRAADHFEKAVRSARDARERMLAWYALGTTRILSGDPGAGVRVLRLAVTNLLGKPLLEPDVPSARDAGQLGSYHVYHNLVIGYRLLTPESKNIPANFVNPWETELSRTLGEAGRGVDNPHSAFIESHRAERQPKGAPHVAPGDSTPAPPSTTPLNLIWANSNLERLYGDPANVRRSLLIPYTSFCVLRELDRTRADGLRFATEASTPPATDSMPVWEIDSSGPRRLASGEAAGIVAGRAAREALRRGELELARKLAKAASGPAQAQIDRVVLAVSGVPQIEKWADNPSFTEGSEIRRIGTAVLEHAELAEFAPAALIGAQAVRLVPLPDGPPAPWYRVHWIALNWVTVAAVLALVLLRLRRPYGTLARNVRYWRALNATEYRKDYRHRA